MKVMVTGGYGFIGSSLVRSLLTKGYEVHVVDKLTYAADIDNLPRDPFIKPHFVDICDHDEIMKIMKYENIVRVFHLAAESHVDRSIESPKKFFETNVMGTFSLAEAFRKHYKDMSKSERDDAIFLHVSTDEVFGETTLDGPSFTENTAYHPRSPYAASKAGSDHLISSYRHTYKLPMIITNSCNNYGQRQNEEKLIPKIISFALNNEPVPIYGNGLQVRQWIYVDDHADALIFLSENARPGNYMIGGDYILTNLEIIHAIEEVWGREIATEFVEDRPGHDVCYKVDDSKLRGMYWEPKVSLREGLDRTIKFYKKRLLILLLKM
jgi:dTDP-glucose 4,6-dehydratase